MNPKGNNKPVKPKVETEFAKALAKSPLSLKDIERMCAVNYTTLIDMKLRGGANYGDRTKADVAACLGMSPHQLFPQKKAKYGTPFELLRMAKNKTIEDVHMGTGLSYNILNGLNTGTTKNLSKRTRMALTVYFEAAEDDLFPSAEAKRESDEITGK